MKNKNIKKYLVILFFNLFFFKIYAAEPFRFEVNELTISNEGNTISSNTRGSIYTNDGLIINADTFNYDKIKNTITLKDNVVITDKKNNIKIFSDKIEYNKNWEILKSYNNTKIIISSNYTFETNQAELRRNERVFSSKYKSYLYDTENNFYEVDEFKYFIDEELLKASNFIARNNNFQKSQNSDELFLKNVFFSLSDKNFVSQDAILKLRKDIFDRSENDPRFYAKSVKVNDNLTELNKAIFTSCKINDDCPPWNIKANKILHDKNKKTIYYEKAFLELYNYPVFYFPKFFHPDPTVKRQSGLLKPLLNNSNILGSSIQIPYYHVISDNRDITIKPTLFSNNLYMLQNEFRYKGLQSSLISDISITRGYESSSLSNKKKDINHIFAKNTYELNLPNFSTSQLSTRIERVNNDTYLKVFSGNLSNTNSEILPTDFDNLSSEFKFDLGNSNFDFNANFTVFENLQEVNQSDRYQFVLPHYEFSKKVFEKFNLGYFNFTSIGDNILKNTNNLKSTIINDLNYTSYNFYSKKGFVNNFNLSLKNLNTVAKNDIEYRSSPQIKFTGITEFNSKYPLININNKYKNILSPKLSFRYSPFDLNNYSNDIKNINFDNIFNLNRLGINDGYENGKSLTLGLNYKKEDLENINKYINFNIGSVIRDKHEKNLPITSTLGEKYSNFFGGFEVKWENTFDLDYKFSINNDLNDIEYNSIEVSFNKNNYFTKLNYLNEKGNLGNENVYEANLGYNIDKNNIFKFNTRINKRINLTEYYNLIYEYQNDCLSAGLEFKKTYYEDRDLKPSQDLMFTITIFPITTFEQKIGE